MFLQMKCNGDTRDTHPGIDEKIPKKNPPSLPRKPFTICKCFLSVVKMMYN